MISRFINLSTLLDNGLSAFLLGPRGVGKSILSQEFLALAESKGVETFFIDLLSLKNQIRYLQHPELFRTDIEYRLQTPTSRRKSERLIVLIDEIQKSPQLLDEVHYFLERYPNGRIQFILTGSSSRKLKRSGANLLAGRAIQILLHPLTALETKINLERALQYGTLPRYYLQEQATDQLLEAYVETYLKEEIQEERLVRRLDSFHRFLSIAAQMNGKGVKFSAIGREARISDNTVRDYYSILTDTLLAYELPSWSRSVRKQMISPSRYYFFDCGVLNTILGEQSIAVTPGNRRYGYLFENYIVTEFLRENDYLKTRWKYHYWHTRDGKEVDLVLSRGMANNPIGIEIKSADNVTDEDLEGLRAFGTEYPKASLYCVARVPNPYNLGRIKVLPWENAFGEILQST